MLTQRPTDCTPKAIFNPNGNLFIKGRSFSENPIWHFKPLVTFCKKLRAKEVIFDISMDYLNTASSKCMFAVISAIEDNERIQRAEIRWHFEEDDEDMLETCEIYADMCEKIQFNMLPSEETTLSYSA